jgi:hypothetical protein
MSKLIGPGSKRSIRILLFASICLLLLTYSVLVIIVPVLGLEDFFRPLGPNRAERLSFPLGVCLLLIIYSLLGIKVGWRPRPVLYSTWLDGKLTAKELLNLTKVPHQPHPWIACAIFAAFSVVFAVNLYKFPLDFFKIDQLWHQTFIDYGVSWGTPIFSFGGNILYHFGIQPPFNTHLLPLELLAQAFPPEYRILATVVLYFLAIAGLFFLIGGSIGLQPIPRMVFAGAVALLLTIPRGLDRLFWFVPPEFFTSQLALALWWLEAPILLIATVFLFFLLGQHRSFWGNLVIGTAFAVGTSTTLLSYPAGAVYFVFLTLFYCVGFALTCTTSREFAWKAVVSAGIISVMLIAKVPQFLLNLYSYTYGSYFFERLRAPTYSVLRSSFMVTGYINFRGTLVFLASMIVLVALALSCPKKPVGRIAIAALACEGGIIMIALLNMFLFHAPLSVRYAEVAHSPVWVAYFVLFCMTLTIVLDRRVVDLGNHTRSKIFISATRRRRVIYAAGFLIMIATYALVQPRSAEESVFTHRYPPARSESLAIITRELTISPGKPFRGRLLTLARQWGSTLLPNAGFNELDAAALGVPVINEYAHWTSPLTFVFLRTFFASHQDTFGHYYFRLHTFNLRIARLMGIRMVATNANNDIAGGVLVYEASVWGENSRIFELENTNLGQFSPVSLRTVHTAAEALVELRRANFDPEYDVVVENDVPPGLVPATFVEVTVDRGPTLIIHASSSGRSLLALPFEYSHCLRLQSEPAGARLIPVNLQQTGLLFQDRIEARITYQFGLFSDVDCRGDDIRRANALRLREAAVD